jgi:hypothetical protein
MSDPQTEAVRPDGIDVTITQAGTVLVSFAGVQTPPIRLSAANAKRVGGTISKAGDTAGDGREELRDE